MKFLTLGLVLAITPFSCAHAQRSPETLPSVTVDCFQSFASKTQLPDTLTRTSQFTATISRRR